MSKYTPATFQPVVRPDWAGILSYLSDKEKSEILVALFKYPSVECNSAFWKETIKPDLDLQYSEFTRICAEKSRGVRNRWGKISITDVKDKDKTSITHDIDPEREREKESEKEIRKHKVYTSSIQTTRASFAPPTLDEFLTIAKQWNDTVGIGGFACTRAQAESFWSHYDSQGWMKSNGYHITNIKSAFLSWVKREQAKQDTDTPIQAREVAEC